ncbi:RICIN domain-containing protein [Rhizobium mayense]|uniref:RICIN domain-containing protein n=1 Tax=Rhizobium mayense TaxID=1312184 RepID=UPI00398C745E
MSDQQGPAPDNGDPDDFDDLDHEYNALNERTRKHYLREAELEVSEAERQLQMRVAQAQKEAADDRAAILSAVRTSTPDITSKLVSKMDEMSVSSHEFTERDKTTLIHLANLQLNDSQDFFDLNPAQREDLLDRVGFYRGISIDQRASNQIQVGFRDVLRRPGAVIERDAEESCSPSDRVFIAKPLYRKPAFAGYFENYFTFSEEVHQNQKNGVTNLKFSLAASAGVAVRGGVGVSIASSQQSQIGDGGIQKTVFITSNFFLPRIELSFDDRKPCASKDFIDACREAIEEYQSAEGRFYALRKVLDAFGHFVPTMTLVGGRLFATETKIYEGSETTSDVTQRFAASLKASLKTIAANVEAAAEGEYSEQLQAKEHSKSENQAQTFHAVGGEGGLVQDAGNWLRSLMDYRRWSAVQREDLIPSINLLPVELSRKCWSVLTDFAAKNTKRDLLYKENAAFVFYGEYGDRVGHLAAETWFVAENAGLFSGLTVSQTPPTDGGSVGLVELVPADTQTWRMSTEGHLIAFVTRPASLKGRGALAEFAISVGDIDPKAAQADIPVSLQQVGTVEHQLWSYSGAGTFTSMTLKGNYVLAVNKAKRLVARQRSKTGDASELWNLIEVNPSVDLKTSTKMVAARPNEWFTLRIADNEMVLSLRNAEGLEAVQAENGAPIVMLPDVGGAHQLWTTSSDGLITSRIKAVDGDVQSSLLLTADNNGLLIAKRKTANERQRWSISSEGYLKPVTENEKVATAGKADSTRGQAYSVSLEEQADTDRQRWSVGLSIDSGNELKEVFPTQTEVYPYSIYSFCSLPIQVKGKIRGMRFKAYNRGRTRDGWGLKCELYVQRSEGTAHQWVSETREPDESDPAQVAYVWSDKSPGRCYLQDSLLYLPSHPISELRFAFAPGSTILTPMYRYEGRSDWVFSEPSYFDMKRDADNLVVVKEGVIADPDKDVLALGFRRQEDFLTPRILVGKRIAKKMN